MPRLKYKKSKAGRLRVCEEESVYLVRESRGLQRKRRKPMLI